MAASMIPADGLPLVSGRGQVSTLFSLVSLIKYCLLIGQVEQEEIVVWLSAGTSVRYCSFLIGCHFKCSPPIGLHFKYTHPIGCQLCPQQEPDRGDQAAPLSSSQQ